MSQSSSSYASSLASAAEALGSEPCMTLVLTCRLSVLPKGRRCGYLTAGSSSSCSSSSSSSSGASAASSSSASSSSPFSASVFVFFAEVSAPSSSFRFLLGGAETDISYAHSYRGLCSGSRTYLLLFSRPPQPRPPPPLPLLLPLHHPRLHQILRT